MGSLAVPSIPLKNGIRGQLCECKESRFSRHQGSQPNEAHGEGENGQGAGTSSPQDYTLLLRDDAALHKPLFSIPVLFLM